MCSLIEVKRLYIFYSFWNNWVIDGVYKNSWLLDNKKKGIIIWIENYSGLGV